MGETTTSGIGADGQAANLPGHEQQTQGVQGRNQGFAGWRPWNVGGGVLRSGNSRTHALGNFALAHLIPRKAVGCHMSACHSPCACA